VDQIKLDIPVSIIASAAVNISKFGAGATDIDPVKEQFEPKHFTEKQ